jgi:hypothetical protein
MALTCFCVAFLCVGMGFGGYTDDVFVFTLYWLLHLVGGACYTVCTIMVPLARFSDDGQCNACAHRGKNMWPVPVCPSLSLTHSPAPMSTHAHPQTSGAHRPPCRHGRGSCTPCWQRFSFAVLSTFPLPTSIIQDSPTPSISLSHSFSLSLVPSSLFSCSVSVSYSIAASWHVSPTPRSLPPACRHGPGHAAGKDCAATSPHNGGDRLEAVYVMHAALYLVYVGGMLSITYFSFLKPNFFSGSAGPKVVQTQI